MDELTTDALAALDLAASLLEGVGCTDPNRSYPDARLRCLIASECLRVAGATADRVNVDPGDADTSIRAALQALAGLPPPVFAQRPVLEAARNGRRALRLL